VLGGHARLALAARERAPATGHQVEPLLEEFEGEVGDGRERLRGGDGFKLDERRELLLQGHLAELLPDVGDRLLGRLGALGDGDGTQDEVAAALDLRLTRETLSGEQALGAEALALGVR
jgi:hypothetical protein